MGKEGDEARREAELGPYWINESLAKRAKPDALVMHCLPAHRGQEIEEKTFEAHTVAFFFWTGQERNLPEKTAELGDLKLWAEIFSNILLVKSDATVEYRASSDPALKTAEAFKILL